MVHGFTEVKETCRHDPFSKQKIHPINFIFDMGDDEPISLPTGERKNEEKLL